MDAAQTTTLENKDKESDDGQGIPTERSEDDGEDETQGPSANVVKSNLGVQEQQLLEGGEAEDGENNIAEPAQNNDNNQGNLDA